jgi:glutamate synthase (NADPH) small chain
MAEETMAEEKETEKKSRQMPEQEPKVRARNFFEVPTGYTPEMAVEEASRCLQCKKPGCVEGCPVRVDIPGFIKLITKAISPSPSGTSGP